MNTPWLRLLPLFLLLLLAIGLASGLLSKSSKEHAQVSLVGYQPGVFSVPSLAVGSTPAGTFSPSLWRGRVVVLNVFASWCAPCAIEHAALMRLAQTGKVAIYGLAWKDKPENIVSWVNTRGNPYQAIGVDRYGSATLALALTGVPETYVFAKDGSVFYHHKSVIDDEVVDKVILPLVEKLNAE